MKYATQLRCMCVKYVFTSFQMMCKWRVLDWSVVWIKAVMSQNLQNTALTQVELCSLPH